MELHLRMAALESRARALGLTLTELCQETGVARATMSRWRNGRGSPSLRNYAEAFGKLEAALDARELAMRDYLLGLWPLDGGGTGAGGGASPAPHETAQEAPHPGPLPQSPVQGGGERERKAREVAA